MTFVPPPEFIQQLLVLLNSSKSSPDARVHEKLELLSRQKEFCPSLAFILAEMKQEGDYSRTLAGLLLKNNIKTRYRELSPELQHYVKSQLLITLGDPVVSIRQTVGIIVTTIISADSFTAWPDLLNHLIALLDHPDTNRVDGAFGALHKICEDSSSTLSKEVQLLTYLIPKFLHFFQSPVERLRHYAISCINQFLVDMPSALAVKLPEFLEGLFYLAKNDPSVQVRKKVCHAFVVLIEIGRIDQIMPRMNELVDFMISATQDQEESVATEACEFWISLSDQEKDCKALLHGYLPRLLPVLLSGMQYSDMDLILMKEDETADWNTPDQEKDIKPIVLGSKQRGVQSGAGEGEEGYEEEDDFEDDMEEVSQWSLRKYSASALDNIAYVFEADLLPILVPILQEKLNVQDPWVTRESAILALGAIASGCYDGITQYLPSLIPFLMKHLHDKRPLIRSITCWTLSRYSKWIAAQPNPEYLGGFMNEILNCIRDANKKVQISACSAMSVLEEEAKQKLLPFLGPTLETLMFAYQKYQTKSLFALYDTIASLAESVGTHLNNPQYVNILMPPLIARWNTLADNDRNLLPLFECILTIAVALGIGFQNFAPPVYTRCVNVIQNTIVASQFAAKNNQEGPDKDFVIYALDLVSGLCEGLKASMETLIASSNLIPILFECIMDKSPEVRQSAFAVIADCGKYALEHLKPHLGRFIPVIIHNLQFIQFVPTCNNACWCLGELAIRLGPEINPFVPTLLENLMKILLDRQVDPSTQQNASITIGRLGLICPEIVAPHLPTFIRAWCTSMKSLKDETEKDSAFRGLCNLIKMNPRGVMDEFVFLCDAIASFANPKQDLKDMFFQILHGFKGSIGPDAWNDFYNRFPAQLRKNLSTKYQL